MFKNLLKPGRVFVPAIVGCVLAIGLSSKAVYAQCCPPNQQSGHADNQGADHFNHQASGPSSYQAPLPLNYQTGASGHQHAIPGIRTAAYAPAVQQPQHGGQIKAASPFTFEVVYQPKEIRLYVYGPNPQGVAIRDIKGAVALKVRNNSGSIELPLNYVAPPAGSAEQDYLAAAVDLSKLKNGDASVTFKLDNLPDANRAKAAFTQTFVLTKVKPRVTLAAVNESDRAGIAQQKVCPVMGTKLGSMGTPVKVLVGDQPLYLCCQGCLGKLKSDPEKYLAKVKQSHTNH